MEWLLLFLLGSVAAGAAGWLLREDKEQKRPDKEVNAKIEPLEEKITFPEQKDTIPEMKRKISFQVAPDDVSRLRDFLDKAPQKIQPDVKETDNIEKAIEEIKKGIQKRKKPLRVTYLTDEIIPRTSPFSRHRRPLFNAEKFVEEQKAKEALTIYERMLQRIPDEEIQKKIQNNIEDIKRWLLGLDEEEDQPLEFPEIIVPLSLQTFALEKFNEGLRQISEMMARDLASAITEGLKEIKADLKLPENLVISTSKIESKEGVHLPKIEAQDIEIKNDLKIPAINSEQMNIKDSLQTEKIETKESIQSNRLTIGNIEEPKGLYNKLKKSQENLDSVSEDEAKEGGLKTSGGGGGIGIDTVSVDEAKVEKIQTSDSAKDNDFIKTSPLRAELSELKQIIRDEVEKSTNDVKKTIRESKEGYNINVITTDAVNSRPITGNIYLVHPLKGVVPDKKIQKEKGIAAIKIPENYLPVGPQVPSTPGEYLSHITNGEGFKFDSKGNLITEGWTDEDFDREWEKYKHLPLIDRRSGIERRKEFHFDPERPDRRSGEDRRKVDLIKERDEFLEKYHKHLERKKILQEQKQFINLYDEKEIKEQPILEKQEIKDIIIPILPADTFSAVDSLKQEIELEELQLPDSFEERIEEPKTQEEIISLEDLDLPDSFEEDSIINEYPEFNDEKLKDISFQGSEKQIDLEILELPEAIEESEKEKIEVNSEIPKIQIVNESLEPLSLPDPEEIVIIDKFEDIRKGDLVIPSGKEEQPVHDLLPSLEPEQKEQEKSDDSKSEEKPGDTAKEEQKQNLGEGVEDLDFPELPDYPQEKGPVQEIRGVLELKPPDEDDAPFLTLTYDFSKIPDSFQLSKNYHTLEYVYYKYKPLLIKAQEFARRKMIKNALNYYRMIKSQNIPPEFKRMINRNIQDITDYIEKFMMSRSSD